MKRIAWLAGGAALAFSSTLAFAGAPEDLLPPQFRDPPPRQAAPTPSPAPTPRTPAPSPAPAPAAPGTSSPVIQPVPRGPSAPPAQSGSGSTAGSRLPASFPSLAEIEAMEEDEIDALLGLRPRFDIPAGARRAVREVGVIARAEGGFPVRSLAGQPAALVRAALVASDGPVVSRWGHILLRRALASRLDAPQNMDPVEFAALRARSLNALGEGAVARALVQDIEGANYNRALADAAFDAYLATGDVLGMCPVARLQTELREDGEWEMLQAICASFLGDTRSADRQLQRALGTGLAPEIDVRLAQRYAGAAGEGSRAVNVEWGAVEELTPWRFALGRALGADIPDELREGPGAGPRYDIADVMIPAVPLLERVSAADRAGERGVLSSAAMVDLYSQLWASEQYAAGDKTLAAQLREAYVASSPAGRIAALRQLWDADAGYGRQVLTAYAAARLPVSEDLADDAGRIIASMLTAGLDRNALRWSEAVEDGSEAWALLALAQTAAGDTVGSGDVESFLDADTSAAMRKSRFLVAGLAGLGRLDSGDSGDLSGQLGINLGRRSAWSDKISRAAQLGNPTLVALLAGLGMQGDSWEQMTARQLFYIVRSLDQVGLSAEARMIAAEAVARG